MSEPSEMDTATREACEKSKEQVGQAAASSWIGRIVGTTSLQSSKEQEEEFRESFLLVPPSSTARQYGLRMKDPVHWWFG